MIAQTVLKPKPITDTLSTCADCRYFSDFGDERGRGLCRVFDTVARRHHRKTETCTSSIKALEREGKPAFLFKVELTSFEVEDDGYGHLQLAIRSSQFAIKTISEGLYPSLIGCHQPAVWWGLVPTRQLINSQSQFSFSIANWQLRIANCFGQPVPIDEKLVEVMVAKPTRALVEYAIAQRKDLHGYEIVNFWQPEDYFEL